MSEIPPRRWGGREQSSNFSAQTPVCAGYLSPHGALGPRVVLGREDVPLKTCFLSLVSFLCLSQYTGSYHSGKKTQPLTPPTPQPDKNLLIDPVQNAELANTL